MRPILFLCCCLALTGCVAPSAVWQPSAAAPNPIFVAANNQEAVWERTITVLHDYQFQIAREDRLDGIIETHYEVGSGLLEPWRHDSVGFENRLEASLQSIRRRVMVSVTPVEGGFLVGIEAFKELEDVVGLAANSPGGATFQEHSPLERNLDIVVGQTAPSGWIPLGRDLPLEHHMMQSLQFSFSR